jgi:hypothetical protein
MIFTDGFIDILTTFRNINPGMFFREGKVQTTIGVNGGKALTFFCRAYTDVEIPKSFAVSNIGKLISIIKLFGTPPEITLENRNLVISGGEKRIVFTLSQPEFISYQNNPDKIKISDGYEARLTSNNISDILNLYGVFNSEHISFIGKNGKFQVLVSSIENSSSDKGIIDIGETDREFNAVIKSSNLQLHKPKKGENYKLLVNKKGIVYIGNENLEYFIPTEAKLSKFGD